MDARVFPKKFFRKYTEHAQKALEAALKNDPQSGGDALDLLAAILRERGSLGASIMRAHRLRPEELVRNAPLRRNGRDTGADTPLSRSLKSVLKRAVTLASSFESRYIGMEHLVAALLEEEKVHALLCTLYSRETMEDLQTEIETLLEHGTHFPDLPLGREDFSEQSRGLIEKKETSESEELASSAKAESKREGRVLEHFTEDLLARAEAGLIDPLVGREEELERLVTILSRRSKNNPLLIGEAGVGKTSIVHGFAAQLAAAQVPEHLAERKLRALDLGLLIAGTVFRGEFEARLKDVIKEAREEHTILFVDEMHTLMGAGSAQGSLDAANMLKPALSTGGLQIIGATTAEEYRKHIEKDPAFERRFQPIYVKEPGARETLRILKGLRPVLEAHHAITISDEILARTVMLCERYLPARCFPDKAIDVLDEASAAARSREETSGVHSHLGNIEQEIKRTRHGKEEAIRKGLYEEATRLKQRESGLQRKRSTLLKKPAGARSPLALLPLHIDRTVSLMAGVPLQKIEDGERRQLLSLEHRLKRHIVGQDRALRELVAALKRARAGVRLPHRPVGSFLFLGPSGVGKTELAKVLARTLFDHPGALIKLDMSEFAESHTTSRLLGAPPGYVGYEEHGGVLERIRRQPHALILFDEIEKAHPHVHHLLLQILEDGELTNARGVRVSFRHALIVLTSNIGTARFLGPSAVGFGDTTGKDIEQETEQDLQQTLPPELLSRLDRTIVFRPLSTLQLEQIVGRELAKLKERLKEQHIALSYTRPVLKYLADRSYSKRDGARKVRVTLQELVEDPLSEKLLAHDGRALKVVLTAQNHGLKWHFSAAHARVS
jgi:ATP-dependent Clp protease ATP-binding subunit ClpC